MGFGQVAKRPLPHGCVALKRRNVADTTGGAGLTGHGGDKKDSGGIWQCHEREGSDVPCQKASQRTSLFGGDMSLVLDSWGVSGALLEGTPEEMSGKALDMWVWR